MARIIFSFYAQWHFNVFSASVYYFGSFEIGFCSLMFLVLHSLEVIDHQAENAMVAYVCKQCGMSIGTMTCGKCGKELQHSSLEKADGSTVHISECPDGHGKVKSPMCCGKDMTCPI
jgi:DNA-directed RNA polymerase subunit RPC12/RpoP